MLTGFECKKCGIKSEHESHLYLSKWDTHPTLTPKQDKCCRKYCGYDKKDNRMQEYKRLGLDYTPFPRITRKLNPNNHNGRPLFEETQHAATRLGTVTNRRINVKMAVTMTYTVVQGIIRHPQHASLKLGEKWHMVVRNTVVRSWSRQGGID